MLNKLNIFDSSNIFSAILIPFLICCTGEYSGEMNDGFSSYPISKRMASWNDSIFLSYGLGIYTYGTYCLIPDANNNRLIQLDTNLTFIRTIGKAGKGPNEFILPFQTIAWKDTIFTYDRANKRINYHSLAGEYLGEIKTPPDVDFSGRMAIDDEFNLYMCTPKSSSSIMKFDLKGNILSRFGASRENYLSIRHLFWTEHNVLLSVGCVEPKIELYNTSGDLISSFNFEKIPEILAAIEDIKKIYAQNNYSWTSMFYSIIYDASYRNGKLYLLYRHNPRNPENPQMMIGNQLLVFNIFPDVYLENKVDLEPQGSERFYLSIAVDPQNTYLYAFENTTKEICKFKIN